MKLLLDTHAFLWFVKDNPRLSNHLKELIETNLNREQILNSHLFFSRNF